MKIKWRAMVTVMLKVGVQPGPNSHLGSPGMGRQARDPPDVRSGEKNRQSAEKIPKKNIFIIIV